MLNSITIKNFKAIGENELTLNNLTSVNYLVGPNGCGKSSVLEILLQTSLINEQNTELKYKEYTSPLGFFHGIDKDLLRKLQVENLEINLISELKIDSKTVKYKIRNQKFELIGAFKTEILNFNSLINGEKPYGLLSSILKPNKNNIRAYIDGMGPGTIAMGLPICSEERWKNYSILSINYQEEYYTNLFSYGQSYFHSVCYLLRSIFTQQLANKKNIEMICIFEEPEKYLHPEYQKLIPLVFDSILNDFPNVKFIFSTHSPFIISASSEFKETQKVYLIDKGRTVDLNGESNKRSQEGYSGLDCIYAVNQMLGAEKQDFGLPENYILVEELSKKVFLDALFARGQFKKSIAVIPATFGGDGPLPEIEDYIKNLVINNALFLANVVFGQKYIVFTDYYSEYYDEQNEKWIKKSNKDKGNKHSKAMNMKKALGARFVAVSEELETCYPKELLKDTDYKDWLEGSFADYLNKKNIPKEDRGKLKSNLAKIIGDTITPQQFKDKFKELHDCIFLR